MYFKPAKQGSHVTLNPFDQTLGRITPFGGEARGSGRPLAGVWGRAPKGCWLARNELKKKPFLSETSKHSCLLPLRPSPALLSPLLHKKSPPIR